MTKLSMSWSLARIHIIQFLICDLINICKSNKKQQSMFYHRLQRVQQLNFVCQSQKNCIIGNLGCYKHTRISFLYLDLSIRERFQYMLILHCANVMRNITYFENRHHYSLGITPPLSLMQFMVYGWEQYILVIIAYIVEQ